MAFHLAHIHDYDRFLAVDIGSYRVRAAVYSLENAEIQELGYANVRQNRKHFFNEHIEDMRGVANTIEQAIIQASQKVDTIPHNLVVSFLSSDFLCDIITTQYIRADTESTLTMQELDTMIKRVESDSYKRAREKARQHSTMFSDDIRLVSSTITSFMIDGKKITHPIGLSGGRITMTLFNVFTPASEFNIIRSIIASLDKKTISLIPMPLLLPKMIEKTDYAQENVCIVDIGYTHITVLILQDGEMKIFETFPIGMKMCMEMIHEKYPKLSLLHIENILCDEHAVRDPKYAPIFNEFFEYTFDMIWGFLEQEHIKITFSDLFVHGSVFENITIFKVFGAAFEDTCGYALRKKRINSLLPKYTNPHQESLTFSLAIAASELLLVKKDPLVRILRYILYNYE